MTRRGNLDHEGSPRRIDAVKATSAIGRNTMWSILGTGLPILLAVVTFPALIYWAGTERFGVLAIAWATLGYLGLFDLGLGRSTTKYLAEDFEHDRVVESRETFWTCLLLSGLSGLLGALLFILSIPLLVGKVLNIPTELTAEAQGAFYLLALGVPLVTLAAALRGTLEAKHRFRLISTLQVPNATLNQAAPLLALLFSYDLRWLVGALVLSRLWGLIVFLVAALRNLERPFEGPFFSRTRLRILLSYTSWMAFGNFISPLMDVGDRFAVATLSSLTAVTYYAAPSEAIKRLQIVGQSLQRTTFPIFSAQINVKQRTHVYTRALKYLALILAPLVATVVVFAPDFLRVWLGSSFAYYSASVLQILAIGLFTNSLAGIPFALIQALGRPDVTFKFHLLELPVFLLLLWYGIQHWGIAGAAMAWTTRVSLDLLLLVVYARYMELVDMQIVTEERLQRILALSLLLLVAGWLLQELTAQPLSKCAIWGLVLGAVMYVAWHKVLNGEDKGRISRYSRRVTALLKSLSRRLKATR